MRAAWLAAVLVLLAAPLSAQEWADTLDRRASFIQGSATGGITYGERAQAALILGDTAEVGANLRQMIGRFRALRTNTLVLRALIAGIRDSIPAGPIDTVPLPPDTIDPPDPPPTGEVWDSTLIGSFTGDVVVPDGERWLVRDAEIAGNLRTSGGTIAMRPGSRLQFIGGVDSLYVGGGMTFTPEFAGDIGLWVSGTGVLDIQGTPKEGWNRTGAHSSWKADDELWIAPYLPGDVTPRRWTPGESDSVPQFDPRVPATEILNVTRDVEIIGPAHIHISSSVPSRIEYVTLRNMGILKPNVGTVAGPTTGRYALHFHMQGEGARGTVVRGVAAINSGGRVYVPHLSHGITFEDIVSVNSAAEAFWWDDGDLTDDVTVDRLAVSGVYTPREVTGQTNRYVAVKMAFGNRMTMTNSVASGGAMGSLSTGFAWSGGARQPTHWTFTGNVAHNNGTGIRFWNNSGQPHHIFDAVSYNNQVGLENGAYANANRYTDVLLVGNGVMQNASSIGRQDDGGPARFTNLHVEAATGPALEIGGRNLASNTYAEFIDSEFYAADGSPKVFVGARGNPWLARFIRTNVLPEDIQWDTSEGRNDGSHVIIEHEDGRRWEVRVENSRVVVE